MLDVSILTSEKNIYEGKASGLFLPGKRSSCTILPGHVPMISELEPGIFKVIKEKEDTIIFAVERGFVQVDNDEVTALLEGVYFPEEISKEVEEKALESLLSKVTYSDMEMHNKQSQINIHRARLRCCHI